MKLFFLFVAVMLFVGMPYEVWAQENTTSVQIIQNEAINPKDGFNYGVKRLKEKLFLMTALSKVKKADYYFKLVDIRLAELKYTIENKDMANFETSTQRYFTTVGQYTEYLTSKKVSYDKKTIEERFKNHTAILEKLRDSFAGDTSEWRFVQDDINYLKAYLEALP